MAPRTAKPPIDRAAEEAQVRQPDPAPFADIPMPTVENSPPCFCRPGPGINSLDVIEITLMYLLSLTNSPVAVEKGALRTLALPAERVEQLSDSARRFMTPAATN